MFGGALPWSIDKKSCRLASIKNPDMVFTTSGLEATELIVQAGMTPSCALIALAAPGCNIGTLFVGHLGHIA